MNVEDHPTVRRLSSRVQRGETQPPAETMLDGVWLRRLALDCGADDAGLVEITRPGLDPQRDEILRKYSWTKSLLGFVVRMAREPLRGAPRSVARSAIASRPEGGCSASKRRATGRTSRVSGST